MTRSLDSKAGLTLPVFAVEHVPCGHLPGAAEVDSVSQVTVQGSERPAGVTAGPPSHQLRPCDVEFGSQIRSLGPVGIILQEASQFQQLEKAQGSRQKAMSYLDTLFFHMKKSSIICKTLKKTLSY